MKYNNLFELSSTFETASGGGTLSYPNLSLIEETGDISSQENMLITFIMSFSADPTVKISFQCENGMTWNDFINSEYNDGRFKYEENTNKVRFTGNYIPDAGIADIIKNDYIYVYSASDGGSND